MDGNESIETKMRKMIRGWERGRIFFLEDFACLGDPLTVRQIACRMVGEGTVLRVARGIYCYPRIVAGEFSSHTVTPDPETVAYALAARENVRIIPYGDIAAEKLGLGGIVVSARKYLTDGSPRVINLTASRKIYFNHTSEVKMFAFRNETMQMLSSAIRTLGAEHFDTAERKRRMREILREIPVGEYAHDITLPPAWVGKIIDDIWNG